MCQIDRILPGACALTAEIKALSCTRESRGRGRGRTVLLVEQKGELLLGLTHSKEEEEEEKVGVLLHG